MRSKTRRVIADVIGEIPYRIALAGGWIDQPFCSKLNPSPPGSMVVIGVEPTFPWLERAGIATGTRKVAMRFWNGRLPNGDPASWSISCTRKKTRANRIPREAKT